ncbi:MAG: protein kinase [Deltaproteobacteria bacterium]|nr:protein kinase [Deltaproteobacteria bacterium]
MEEDSLDIEFIESLESIKTVGRYELIRKLGRGGAGVVYLGKDPYIKRDVAIKISPTTTHKLRERFLVEAQSAGRFSHPNIVAIHDVGVQGDFCYLTMEFIRGDTLEKFCDRDNLLPLNKVVEIILSVCSALDYAHKQGVIHRDIKPENIMLDHEGVLKIADFGVAQMTENTAETGIFGTPNYMSPEQLKDEPIGYQSDIFSLGCVLYKLLTSKQAFPGDNNFTIMYKITNEEPEPMLNIRHDLPQIMVEITRKALAKDLTERYQSCTELAYDLRVALRGLTDTVQDEKIKDVVGYVHHLTFFHEFTEDQVKEIISVSHIIKVDKGKVIVAQGEIDDTFYIMMSGKARVNKDKKDIAWISAGDCLGEMALIGCQVRMADVIADTDCVLMKIRATLLDNASDSVKYLFFKNFAITLVYRLSNISAH